MIAGLFLLPWCCQPAGADASIVINKGTNQLAFYKDGFLLDVFPVATGRRPDLTPEGSWKVVLKTVYPAWRDPKGGPLIPGGVPANPLGPRWLGLDALNTGGWSYGIHGNNNPSSIGAYASSGCIRMYNEDICWVYDRVPVGTRVDIISTRDSLEDAKKFSRTLVNGTVLEYPRHLGPLHSGGLAYLPARATAEAMGYWLAWDEESSSLFLANIDREVQIFPGQCKVIVNNVPFYPEEAPAIIEDLTFVPVYYYERYLGAQVLPDNQNKTINISLAVDNNGLVKYHLTINVNGKPLSLSEAQTPLTDGENILLPLRPVCAAAGAAINWNEAGRAVEISLAGKKILIPVDGTPCLVNGRAARTPSRIFTRNGMAFINVSIIAEIFDFTLDLDRNARTLTLTNIQEQDLFYNPDWLAKPIIN
ncbi:MAG: L,D-transpeptidase family protein [Firmicutes bacterium]|nr:L,D-transpeptidase family protein [Bacillota bacterium]